MEFSFRARIQRASARLRANVSILVRACVCVRVCVCVQVMALTSPKTSVVIVNELRSHSVHAAFMAAFEPTHTIKKMPANKLDDKYQHPLIEVGLMYAYVGMVSKRAERIQA